MGAVVLIAIFLAYGFGRYGWEMFGFDDDTEVDHRDQVVAKWAAQCREDEKNARNHKVV